MIRILLFGLLLVMHAAAEARWREASSRHFVIYSEQGEADLRRFAEELERFDQTLRQQLRRPDPDRSPATRLTIYVLSDIGALQRFLGSEGVAGIYFPRSNGSLAFTSRSGGRQPARPEDAPRRMTSQIVLFHEYTHHFLYNNFSFGAPLWFSEGYPEFWSTVLFDGDGNVLFGIPAWHRNNELTLARPMQVRELLTLRYPIRNGETAAVAYGKGWLLSHYLHFEPSRAGQLNQYLMALGRGQSAEQAATVFGDLGQLNRELDRYFRSPRFNYATILAGQTPPGTIAIRDLSAAEEAVMSVRMRSKRGVTREQAIELVRQARRAAAPYPDDPAAQIILAEAEHDAGNFAQAEAAADRALAASPGMVDAHLYKARAIWGRIAATGNATADQWRDVRRWLTAANRLDPDDPEPLVLFYESFRASGMPPTANAIEGLLFAHQLAPEDRSVRLAAGRERLVAGNAAGARAILTPFAGDYHSGALGNKVGEVLATLAGGDTAAALAQLDAAMTAQATERPDGD